MYQALVVDLAGLDIRVFGGGKVALHKVKVLLKSQAGEENPPRIQVISPDFDPKFSNLPVQVQEGQFSKDQADFYLGGADFVLAATDSEEVNAAIVQASQARKILCETVTDPASPVLTPSIVQGEGLGLYVTSFGAYPSLARAVREHLQADPWIMKFTPSYVAKLAAYREAVLSSRPKGMKDLLRGALDLDEEDLAQKVQAAKEGKF